MNSVQTTEKRKVEIVYKSGSPSVLWKPELQRVYALFGEEDRLKEEAVAALIKHVVSPDFADFDLETLDANTAGADGILSAVGTGTFRFRPPPGDRKGHGAVARANQKR